jgi:hypothetical protein
MYTRAEGAGYGRNFCGQLEETRRSNTTETQLIGPLHAKRPDAYPSPARSSYDLITGKGQDFVPQTIN